jgi:hypothetical protein
MANRAEEARARLEARFRKQYEADRIAEKDRAERDAQVSRERSKPTTRGGSADQKGGRQGGWDWEPRHQRKSSARRTPAPEGSGRLLPSRARLLAQLLEELLTNGGVPLGLLKPMLPLSLMRPLEALPDHAENALPAFAFHVVTSASSGRQLGRASLKAAIESRC